MRVSIRDAARRRSPTPRRPARRRARFARPYPSAVAAQARDSACTANPVPYGSW